MSGSQRMNALCGGNTVTTSAAVVELLGGTPGGGTQGKASGAAAKRTPQDMPGLKSEDTLA